MKLSTKIKIGNLTIGGGEPVAIQSMTNTPTADVEATVRQILSLERCGCEIVRATVNDEAAANAIGKIKEQIHIPLVADIHFDYRLAIKAVEQGVDKVRINPGTIGDESRVKQVVAACKKHHVPIRVGVNGGSLPKPVLERYGGVTPEALMEAAKEQIAVLENLDFYDIVLSLKVSDVEKNIAAYTLASEVFPYPLHTEAGGGIWGVTKNASGIGTLLRNGIGDTLRVSLTESVEEEIDAAKAILSATGRRKEWVEVIACPTCGRTQIDIIALAKEVKEKTKYIKKPLKVAVMGCVVNGPGEAKDCDIGIAGGKGQAVLFEKDKNGISRITETLPEHDIVQTLLEKIEEM